MRCLCLINACESQVFSVVLNFYIFYVFDFVGVLLKWVLVCIYYVYGFMGSVKFHVFL